MKTKHNRIAIPFRPRIVLETLKGLLNHHLVKVTSIAMLIWMCQFPVSAQIQVGEAVEGSGREHYFGLDISLDQDGNRMAVGARAKVQVYESQSGSWVQIGSDLDASQSSSGTGVSAISDDGSIVAVGAPRYDNVTHIGAGQVKVYEYQSNTWVQIGQELNGPSSSWFGSSVSLSSDGSIMAVGSTLADVNGFNSGQVNIYENQEGAWTQIGSPLLGIDVQDRFGARVNLSADGSIVAISANNGSSEELENSGYVKIYENQSGTWTQLGSAIVGEAASDYATYISLSSDGAMVAIGATANDGNGTSSGHVRVFEYASSTWSQVGSDIVGEAAGYGAGIVSMSDDGVRLAIGGVGNDEGGSFAGEAKVFEYQTGSWVQVGFDINGENAGDYLGPLSLSGDGEVLGLGEYRYDIGEGLEEQDAGRVRVFGGLDNQPPTISNPLADIELVQGFGTHVIDLTGVFSDPDGDALNYSATSSLTRVTTVSINRASMTITEGTNLGSTEIAVTANDGDLGEVTNTFTLTVEEPDIEAPFAISYSPANKATGVERDGVYVITFNEEVVKRSGFIRFYNSDGTLRKMVSMGAATINGNIMTIDPEQTFSHEEEVNVRIDAGSVEDLSGNDYAGILDATTWSFTTINEPEVDLSNASIDENESVGTVVGILSTIDPEDGKTYTYNLVPGTGDDDNDSFTVDGNELKSNGEFDFETKSTYSVRIYTFDGSKTFPKVFSISINDISETPTGISLDNTSIDENEASGTVVGAFSTTDSDEGESYTYTFATGDGDTDNDSFTIDGDELKSDEAFDFETKDSYSIRINTNDGNGGNFADEFTITISNVSEVPTAIALDNMSIDENEASGTIVGTFSTTDSDEGESYTYTFATGDGDTDNDSFTIDGVELKSDEAFDFETKDSYSVRINTHDGNGGNFADEFTITINNVSEVPTAISLDNASIDENEDAGTVIGTLSTTDVDDGETYTYTFATGDGDTDNDSFTIDGDELKSDEAFDFETKDSYSIRINSNDGNGGNFDEAFTITIEDVEEDETPPSIASLNPADGTTNVSNDPTYTIVFDEPIQAGSGSIFVQRVSDNIAFQFYDIDASNVYISGNTLTVSPDGSSTLAFESEYFFYLESGAVEDLSGNEFSGLANTTSWTFTTMSKPPITWNGTVWSNTSGPSGGGDDVIIDGDYNMGTDGYFDSRDLTINSGATMTIDGESSLVLQRNLVNDGALVVESGSSLLTYSPNTITGNDITFKRNTRYADGKYSFVGSPVEQDASIIGSDLGSSVYKYNETTAYGADGINRWEDASSDELVPGKGYTQAFQKEIVFTGMPNMGSVTIDGTFTDVVDADHEGWVLVSNPYPAPIDVADFLAINSNTTRTIYIWDDNGSDTQRGTNADYIAANGTMVTNTVPTAAGGASRYDQIMGSMQGFFVKLNSAADVEIEFTEDMRVTGNSDDHFFRETQLPIARINLTNSNGLFKQSVLGLAEDAGENELNRRYDALAFNSTASDGLFTIKSGRSLSLNGMTSDWEVIQLQVNTAESGLYQISVELEEYDQSIYLRDNLTGEIVDLRNDIYSFSVEAGIITDRFELISSPSNVLGLENEKVKVYANNSILHIQQEGNEAREYQLFNMKGQRLLTKSVQNKEEVNLSTYAKGIYLVFDGEKTHKIILD